jgi:histidinol-phosphate aminotransferase
MAAREYLREKGTLVQGHPTFELIGRLAAQHGAKVEAVPVTATQQDDLDRLASAGSKNVSLVYLNWPNNPCGSMIGAAAMRDFVRKVAPRVPVFMDEAYLEYADPTLAGSMVSLVRQGADVIVARTFSKIHGLAGMRMGYAVARPEIAKRLSVYRFSVLNSLALAAASAALDDRLFQDLSRKRNEDGKKLVVQTFEEKGISYIPSSTNFVWFKEEDRGIAAELRKHAILIPNGRFEGGWNRVTIGTMPEMERWAEVMRTL